MNFAGRREAKLLATTSLANQAFAICPNVVGLQFHAEAATAINSSHG